MLVVLLELFRGLKNIKKIILDYNNIRSIFSGFFNGLDIFEVVNLDGNKIVKFDGGVFLNDFIVWEIYFGNNNFIYIFFVIFCLRNVLNIDFLYNLLIFEDFFDVVDSLSEELFIVSFLFEVIGFKLFNLLNNNFIMLDI